MSVDGRQSLIDGRIDRLVVVRYVFRIGRLKEVESVSRDILRAG